MSGYRFDRVRVLVVDDNAHMRKLVTTILQAFGVLQISEAESGERAWVTDKLQYRGLSAPLALGRSVVVGDNTGLVHMLSREDGSPLNRLSTDGSPIVAAPVVAGNTLVVVTRNGGIYGFVPQ